MRSQEPHEGGAEAKQKRTPSSRPPPPQRAAWAALGPAAMHAVQGPGAARGKAVSASIKRHVGHQRYNDAIVEVARAVGGNRGVKSHPP